MKGIKKFSVLALGLAFVVGLASCQGGSSDSSTTDTSTPSTTTGSGDTTSSTTTTTTNPFVDDNGYYNDSNTEKASYTVASEKTQLPEYVELEELDNGLGKLSTLEQPDNYPDVYVNENNKLQYELSDIEVYTNSNLSTARTTFYLGEEFNSDGVVVLAKFLKLNEDGSYQVDENKKNVVVRARVYTFYVDDSAIDTSIVGTYEAQVSYRYGENVKVGTYRVFVRTSEFETTPGLKYVAGINASLKADKITTTLNNGSRYSVLQNDGRIYTRYVGYDDFEEKFIDDFSLDISQLNINMVCNSVSKVGNIVTQSVYEYNPADLVNDKEKRIITSKSGNLTIDYSAVDVTKAGSYKIVVQYKGPGFYIDGVLRENIVQSFIIVDVINPITGVKLVDTSVKNVTASLDGTFDLSAYDVKVYRTFGKQETVAITNDVFNISGGITYLVGEQTVKVTAKELSEFSEAYTVDVKLNVQESDKYSFSIYNNLDPEGEEVKFYKSDGTTIEALGYETCTYVAGVITGTHIATTDSSQKSLLEKAATCEDDGLAFSGYTVVNSADKNSAVIFNMTGAGAIILYVSPNSDESRGFVLTDSNDDVIDTYETEAKKQAPRRYIIYVDQAGTYKLSATTSGKTIQFYGCVVVLEK